MALLNSNAYYCCTFQLSLLISIEDAISRFLYLAFVQHYDMLLTNYYVQF